MNNLLRKRTAVRVLAELVVRDLGVIEELALVLGPGMTAVTGETGAGKTLVVGAIDLLTGGQADASLVRPGAVEAEIEGRSLDGVFVLPNASLRGADEVLVVDRDGVLRERAVEVVWRERDVVIVKQGLSPGERVAVLPGLVPGTRVAPLVTAPALAAESKASLPAWTGSTAGG